MDGVPSKFHLSFTSLCFRDSHHDVNEHNYFDYEEDEEAPLLSHDARHIDDFIIYNGNISNAEEVRENELAQIPVPWMNNSRRRLLLIWGPFQLMTVFLVAYFSVATFSVAPD